MNVYYVARATADKQKIPFLLWHVVAYRFYHFASYFYWNVVATRELLGSHHERSEVMCLQIPIAAPGRVLTYGSLFGRILPGFVGDKIGRFNVMTVSITAYNVWMSADISSRCCVTSLASYCSLFGSPPTAMRRSLSSRPYMASGKVLSLAWLPHSLLKYLLTLEKSVFELVSSSFGMTVSVSLTINRCDVRHSVVCCACR